MGSQNVAIPGQTNSALPVGYLCKMSFVVLQMVNQSLLVIASEAAQTATKWHPVKYYMVLKDVAH
ncbi:hypothetical protein DPMN_021252 [Dreissena polymorpha]|uniref:Uncharacterized protein n=1 Tax=Dreissena polymorpha TaxID=45954 RepID=A0A9D4NLV0_DREPO|nr:hypothetical protein DPMN_021252 [Dreissena polymorpha]